MWLSGQRQILPLPQVWLRIRAPVEEDGQPHLVPGVSAAPAEGHRPTLLDTYLATLTFEAFGDETILIMRAEFDSAAGLAFARSGGFYVGTNQALDKLERLLASH